MRPTPSLEPAPAYDSIVQITDEVWIAQRTATVGGSWYLLKLGKSWLRRSLRTKSLPDAKAKALRLYQEWLQDSDAVIALARPAPRKSFKKVAEEWLAAQTKDKAYKAAIIRKFLVPFFYDLRQLESRVDLDQAMVDDYLQWRRAAYLQVPRDENGQAVPPTVLRISKKQFQTYAEPSPEIADLPLCAFPAGRIGALSRVWMPCCYGPASMNAARILQLSFERNCRSARKGSAGVAKSSSGLRITRCHGGMRVSPKLPLNSTRHTPRGPRFTSRAG